MSAIETLQNVVHALETSEIPYMVSGSIALGCYTVMRTTRGIDIVVELQETDIQDFLSGFDEAEYYHYEPAIRDEVRRRGMFNLISQITGFKIDFIVRKASDYAKVAFSRRRICEEFGVRIWVILLEDPIIAKLDWIQDYQSDRQIEDIQALLENKDLDRSYMLQWIDSLKLKTFGLIYDA